MTAEAVHTHHERSGGEPRRANEESSSFSLRATRGGLSAASAVGLEAAIEHVPGAAFVVDERAGVVCANRAARRDVELRGDAVWRRIGELVAGAPRRPGERVSPLFEAEGARIFFVALGERGMRLQLALERARARWSLTTREVEVLREIASGKGNREAAAELGLARRTIELHTTALLRRAGVRDRSQLLLALWRENSAFEE